MKVRGGRRSGLYIKVGDYESREYSREWGGMTGAEKPRRSAFSFLSHPHFQNFPATLQNFIFWRCIAKICIMHTSPKSMHDASILPTLYTRKNAYMDTLQKFTFFFLLLYGCSKWHASDTRNKFLENWKSTTCLQVGLHSACALHGWLSESGNTTTVPWQLNNSLTCTKSYKCIHVLYCAPDFSVTKSSG